MSIPLVDLKAQYKGIKIQIDSVIREVLDKSSFIMGQYVERFEKNLAEFCDCKYAIGVSSGTSALFLVLKAYGISEGDEVITVPNTFIATVEAIVHCGAKPVFVDIEEKTMLIDPKKLEQKITKNTKAIIPVHLYGQTCDMEPIIQIAKKHKLVIIEDAAQAIDAEYENKKIPIYETATLSFFPAKNLGCYGDGGAVITKNEQIAKKVSKLRDHGRINKYESDILGYGERLDSIQAAILDVKLKHLKDWTGKRRENARIYNQQLKEIKEIQIPFEQKKSKHVYYMYEIRAKDRDNLINFLESKEIHAGIHYPVPLHIQRALAFLGYTWGDFPITEKAAKEILSLPMFPELEQQQINFICSIIKEFYKQNDAKK